MGNGQSTILIIAGVGLGLALLLLLLGGNPEPPVDASSLSPPVPTGASRPAAVTTAPAVDAGSDRTVGERETIRLAGEAYDPEGRNVTYTWTAQGGLGFFGNAHDPRTTYTAPSACDCEETVILTLTATAASGATASDQLTIYVRDPLLCPTATAESCGYFVVVPEETCSRAPEAVCPAHPDAACATPCITEVPAPEPCAVPPVACPCADTTSECAAPWQTGWPFETQPVQAKDRAQPSIDRHFPAQIDEQTSAALRGAIRNPACQSVCFAWSASKGRLEGADTLHPIYYAPESNRRDGETVTISLIVYDAANGPSYDQIRIKIRNTNP